MRQAIMDAIPTGVSFAVIIVALAELIKAFQEREHDLD